MKSGKPWLVLLLMTALLCTACGKKDDQGENLSTGAQTTEAQSTAAETETDGLGETEAAETSNSAIVSSFDGQKNDTYLKKYGLSAYRSSLMDISAVNPFKYIDVGDGVEIYQGDVFCGWLAAWDFGDVSESGGDAVIGEDTIDDYVERRFGGVHSMGTKRLGKEEISEGCVRYDFEVKALVQKGDDWLIATGIYGTEKEKNERGTYSMAVSAYCSEDSNYGYILCLETSTLSGEQTEKLMDAVSFKKNSFTKDRRTAEVGHSVQELYSAVERSFPYVKAYREMCQWYKDYNGEKLQRIPGTEKDNYSPAVCPDIVFYRADAGETMDNIVKAMFNAMMEPLTKKTDARPFTVTKYFLDQQEILIYEGRENTWLLPFLNGYYAYEGTDMVPMETAKTDGHTKDGMVEFFRQGSPEVFQFVLMKEGNVYRLQRAEGMGLEVKSEKK